MADHHAPYHMLQDAFAQAGCPVCRIVSQNILRYLDLLMHEGVNDIEFRDQIRQSGGFCNTHAWWLVTRIRGGALGSAIIYRDVLHALRGQLAPAASGGGPLATIRRRRSLRSLIGAPAHGIVPGAGCPACAIRGRDDAVFVGALVANANDWRFLEAYAASSGVCFPHLEQATAMADEDSAHKLLEAHAKIVDRMIAELDEFQRKSDYRFYTDAWGAEADSWQRAIELAIGYDGAR